MFGIDNRVLVYIALVLLFVSSYRPNPVVFLGLVFITAYWTTKNVLYSIYISVGIVLLLQLCCGCLVDEYERFENNMRKNALIERLENQIQPVETDLGSGTGASSGAISASSASSASVVEDALKKAVEAKGDTPVAGNGTDYINKINTYDLEKAQKETFKMVDSISQLKDVMASLSPLLKQGGEVIKMMDQLKVSGGI